jgi:hypothetical protein
MQGCARGRAVDPQWGRQMVVWTSPGLKLLAGLAFLLAGGGLLAGCGKPPAASQRPANAEVIFISRGSLEGYTKPTG